jgi:hypothetical protein
MKFYMPDCDFYQTDHEGRHKIGTATRFCIPTETLKCFLQLFINLYKDWSDTENTEILVFRSRFILAGDLNAKPPVWNSKF